MHISNEVFESVSATEEELYQHDPSNLNSAMRLAALTFPSYPVPLGVYYQKSRDLFALKEEVDKTVDDLPALFRSKASWQQS